MSISLYIAIGIIVIIIAYMIIQQILNKRAVNELDQNEFHKGLRKAQVIDVREKVDYDYGHINGARNIPITVFKQRFQGLRNDQPIYLCDANGIASYRAARILRKNGYCDYYDEIAFAIKYGQLYKEKYTHIVLDDVEVLTKGEIEFVKSIYSNNAHSSFVFILNNEFCNDKMCWLVKGRRLKTLGVDFKGRSFAFKKDFKEEKNKEKNYMEKFEYVNLKYKNIVEFNIDSSSSKKEIYLGDNTIFNEEELVEVDVYSDIAAGNPIEINDEVEEKFNLPKSWLEKGKETFILHVKGDSMIEKNINDGDLVVIKRQNTALNNDIVAASLDGEATLKTLKLNGKEPMLIPANPKYSEIYLEGKEVNILGVAIGVIKNKFN